MPELVLVLFHSLDVHELTSVKSFATVQITDNDDNFRFWDGKMYETRKRQIFSERDYLSICSFLRITSLLVRSPSFRLVFFTVFATTSLFPFKRLVATSNPGSQNQERFLTLSQPCFSQVYFSFHDLLVYVVGYSSVSSAIFWVVSWVVNKAWNLFHFQL